jgi:hypothetical protein
VGVPVTAAGCQRVRCKLPRLHNCTYTCICCCNTSPDKEPVHISGTLRRTSACYMKACGQTMLLGC